MFINLFNRDKKLKKIQEVENNENYLSKGTIKDISHNTCSVPSGLLGEYKYIVEIDYVERNIASELLEFETQEEQLKVVSKLKEKMNVR